MKGGLIENKFSESLTEKRNNLLQFLPTLILQHKECSGFFLKNADIIQALGFFLVTLKFILFN